MTETKLIRNPGWWTSEHDNLWKRSAKALKQNWENLRQRPGRRNALSAGTHTAHGNSWEIPPRENTEAPEQLVEEALRFGSAARLRYQPEYPMWGDALESRLRLDWETMFPDRREDWESDVAAIHFAWHQEFEG